METSDKKSNFRDDLSAALNGDDEADDAAATPVEDPIENEDPEAAQPEGESEDQAVAEQPPLEAPAMWSREDKEAFAKLTANPNLRPYAERWANQWREFQGYQTRKEQEAAAYKRQFEPIEDVLRPHIANWQRQGMGAQQAIGRLVYWDQQLAADPQAALIQLAQAYNVDLGQALQEQPYVAPEVQRVEQGLAQIAQYLQAQQQTQIQQQQHRLVEDIQAFADARDEAGNPKAPYFNELYDQMVQVVQAGMAKDLPGAYEKAVLLNPEVRQRVEAERAARDATTRAAAAKKAAVASKTVKGKGDGDASAGKGAGFRDDLRAELAAAGIE